MQLHLDWLVNAAATLGKGPNLDDDETRDARAVANAQVERMRALRSDLADLAADAEAQLPAGMASRGNIVSEPEMPTLPDTLGPAELALVERSFSAGMARYVHEASMALRPLRRRYGSRTSRAACSPSASTASSTPSTPETLRARPRSPPAPRRPSAKVTTRRAPPSRRKVRPFSRSDTRSTGAPLRSKRVSPSE